MVPLLVLLYVPLYLTQNIADPPPGCGVYHKNYTISPEWEKLFDAGKKLMVFYNNLTSDCELGNELVRTALIYLEQIKGLEQAMDENRPRAMDAVWELYLCRGPLHLKQIPYGEFIRVFNWNSDDVNKYFTIMDDTRGVWNRLVEELERLADSDIII